MTTQSNLSNSHETYFYGIYHILIELEYYKRSLVALKQEKVEWDFSSQNTEWNRLGLVKAELRMKYFCCETPTATREQVEWLQNMYPDWQQ